MQCDLLPLLRCPGCDGPLSLSIYRSDPDREVTDGLLACKCGLAFAVWRGVPRLVLELPRRLPPPFLALYPQAAGRLDDSAETNANAAQTANLYDAQWAMYEFSPVTWALDLETRIRFFEHYLRMPVEALAGKWLLDAGCGNGTLSAALAARGISVVAFDYSGIVERAEAHRREFAGTGTVHFIMADIQKPPLAPGTFDVVYSDGVVHLTASPHRAFHALSALLRPGGRMIVTVSRHDRRFSYRLHRAVAEAFRKLALRMPLWFGKAAATALAATLNVAGAARALLSGAPRKIAVPISQRAFGLWHSFVHPQLRFFSAAELQTWFREAGFASVEDTTIAELGATGCAATGILGDVRAPAQ